MCAQGYDCTGKGKTNDTRCRPTKRARTLPPSSHDNSVTYGGCTGRTDGSTPVTAASSRAKATRCVQQVLILSRWQNPPPPLKLKSADAPKPAAGSERSPPCHEPSRPPFEICAVAVPAAVRHVQGLAVVYGSGKRRRAPAHSARAWHVASARVCCHYYGHGASLRFVLGRQRPTSRPDLISRHLMRVQSHRATCPRPHDHLKRRAFREGLLPFSNCQEKLKSSKISAFSQANGRHPQRRGKAGAWAEERHSHIAHNWSARHLLRPAQLPPHTLPPPPHIMKLLLALGVGAALLSSASGANLRGASESAIANADDAPHDRALDGESMTTHPLKSVCSARPCCTLDPRTDVQQHVSMAYHCRWQQPLKLSQQQRACVQSFRPLHFSVWLSFVKVALQWRNT